MSEVVVRQFEEIVATTSPRVRFRIESSWDNGDFHIFLWKLAAKRKEPVRLKDDDKVALCRLAESLAGMLSKSLRRLYFRGDYELAYAILTPRE